ncbi:MAG: TlpA family protein disulfide reductase [Deltaproteobacteria bacterium]|nr:MAG: TlpA family protein disulfide reductase [Deltaproteobacteria bacterium]
MRNRKGTSFLLACIGILFIFLSIQLRAIEDPWKGLGVIRLSGHSPPDFTLPTLDGGSMTLSDLKGKVVLINFWATWCPPCREEMPSLERLYRHFKYEKFTLLAVDIMEHPETVKTFAREYNLSFPILLDKKGEVSQKYAANALPTTYVIDKEGKAVGKAIGPRKWDGDHAKDLINELLGR